MLRNKFVWISLFEKKIYDIFDMNKGGKSHQEHSPGAANNAVHVNSLLLNFSQIFSQKIQQLSVGFKTAVFLLLSILSMNSI